MANAFWTALYQLPPEELEGAGVIERARTSSNNFPTYICPFCGNGSGKNGTGLTVLRFENGYYNYHCFGKCGGENYNAYDLIAAHLGTERGAEVAKFAKERFNLRDDYEGGRKNFESSTTQESEVEEKISAEEKQQIKNWLEDSQKNLREFVDRQGGSYRGLSYETLKNACCGYAEKSELNGQPAAPYLLFPTENGYFARLTDEKNFPNHKTKLNSRGKKKIYGLNRADFPQDKIFVVEGIIDCISINQSGFSAIALLGSAVQFNMITEKNFAKDTKFIVILDNDAAGNAAAKKVADEFKKAGYPAVVETLSDDYKDANEFLQADSDGLRARLKNLMQSTEKEFEKILGEIQGYSRASYFKNFFVDILNSRAVFSNRCTGFNFLDREQKFLPGLYVVGGIPAVGKTTFTWQMLEQIASRGETCIFCSYEMSMTEIFAKSLSRRLFKDFEIELTVANILAGKFGEFLKDETLTGEPAVVMNQLENSEDDLRVLETDKNIDEMLEQLKKICEDCEKPPIIAIDYLQIIPSAKDTIKMAVDDTIRKLKNFQRETNATFLVISSLNRQNYKESATFESFKESGGIEYSADVVWCLQFYREKDDKGEYKILNNSKIEEMKKENPRKINLKCLKNRYGGNYDCYFRYYPAADYFENCEDFKFENLKINNGSGRKTI